MYHVLCRDIATALHHGHGHGWSSCLQPHQSCRGMGCRDWHVPSSMHGSIHRCSQTCCICITPEHAIRRPCYGGERPVNPASPRLFNSSSQPSSPPLHLVALLSCILSMPVLANPRNRRARHQAPARRCLTRMRPDASLLCTVVLHLGQTCAHMLVVLRAALHRVVAQGCPSGRLCTDFTRTPSLAATTVPHVGHVACCRFSETFWVCVV